MREVVCVGDCPWQGAVLGVLMVLRGFLYEKIGAKIIEELAQLKNNR